MQIVKPNDKNHIWFDLKTQKVIVRDSNNRVIEEDNLVGFKSYLEYLTYQKLVSIFGIKAIRVHPLLWLVPYGTQAFPKGVSWSCSFVIRDSSNKVRYFIETTKKIDEILQLKIALLEAYHSTIFDRTVIVLEKKYRTLFLESTPDKITVNCLEEYFKSIPKYSVL